MLGRGGSWIGNTIAGLTVGRVWLYQDFVAGSGPGLTITTNSNGTGLAFDANMIVDSSAVVVKAADNEPIFSNTAELPTQLVKVSAHTGASVTLNSTPAVGEGAVRVWYLYAMALTNFPSDAETAPFFVRESRTEFLDVRFLNATLNLSDLTNASTARTNLGLGTAAVQNVGFFLQTANNLSDITDAAAARTSLGLGSSATHPASDFEVPLTFSTGLTRTVNTVTVNASQNITTLSNLTSNGVVITSGGTGALSVEAKASAATVSTIMERDASGNTAINKIQGTGDGTTPAFWVDTGGGSSGFYFGSSGTTFLYNTGEVASFVGSIWKFNVPVQVAYASSVSSPAIFLSTENTTGFYRIGANNWGFSVSSTKVLDISSTGLLIAGTLDMNSHRINNVTDPSSAQDAATKAYVDKKGKSGKVNLSVSTTTKAITFATTRSDALYTPSFWLINTTDTNPIGIPVRIIAIASTGFTAEWDDQLPTANYVGYWSIQEHYDP